MYILQSAAKNLRRYAGRYLLFGALIFAVLAVGAVSLMAGRELDTALETLMNQYGGTVTVDHSYANPLKLEEYDSIAELDEVAEIQHPRFYFEVFQAAITIDGQRIQVDNVLQSMKDRGVYPKLGRDSDKFNFSLSIKSDKSPNIGVLGIDFAIDPTVNHTNPDSYFYEGRYPENENECALNQNYLDWCGFEDIKLGSTVTLTLGDTVREYTVVGLEGGITFVKGETLDFKTKEVKQQVIKSHMCPILLTYDAANSLYLDGTLERYYLGQKQRVDDTYGLTYFEGGEHTVYTVDENNNVSSSVKTSEGTYASSGISLRNDSRHTAQVLLKSHTLYDSFRASLDALSETTGRRYRARLTYPEANTLLEAYGEAVNLTSVALAAVLAIAAVVILVMTALGMHERKYEIGVLLSVGMQKGRIVALFALENLIFTLAVAALAYAAGLAAAPAAAQEFLTGVITLSRANTALPVAAQMLALAVGLSIPASLISSVAILAFKPMTILRSRT